MKEKQIVVITGSGGAIGSAMARGFASRGDTVIVNDVNEQAGTAVVDGITKMGGCAFFLPLDLACTDSIPAFFKEVESLWGPVDVLVNNAGVNLAPGERRPFDRFLEEGYHRIMDIDLWALAACCRAVIPGMIRQGNGKILNISSVAAVATLRNQAAFVAAKAAVIALTRAMAVDYAGDNIQVNGIAPGSIAQSGTRDLLYGDPETTVQMLSHIPAGRPGEPEDIIGAALFLCDPGNGYITGHTLVVDGGWTAGFTRRFA